MGRGTAEAGPNSWDLGARVDWGSEAEGLSRPAHSSRKEAKQRRASKSKVFVGAHTCLALAQACAKLSICEGTGLLRHSERPMLPKKHP